jgi:hypothetical protein
MLAPFSLQPVIEERAFTGISQNHSMHALGQSALAHFDEVFFRVQLLILGAGDAGARGCCGAGAITMGGQ